MSGSRHALDQQAWRWIARRDSGRWSAEDEASFEAWLAEDPKHEGAMLEAEALWTVVGEASGRQGKQNENENENENEDNYPNSARTASWLSRRRVIAGGVTALAASFAAVMVLGTGITYSTDIGEIRRVPLADGSVAAINTASRIALDMRPEQREVYLQQGEAWFQVAKDAERPFIVAAGPIRVAAVGTAFSVRRHDNGADVLVTEGIVETWAEGVSRRREQLVAGQRAFIADNARIHRAPAEIADIDRALAWRNGRVDFVDKPIGEAVEEFNRYNRRQLVIAEPSIARERFDGVFRTDDPDGFALAVRDSLGVSVNLSDPTQIRIGER